MWDERDTKKVRGWLRIADAVTLMPFAVTILITFYLEVSSLVFFPASINPFLTLGYSYHGIEVNFIRVYPIFSSIKLAMLIVTVISLVLFGVVTWYREFVDLLKNVGGYERFGDVKKAMDSLRRGSDKDKTMFLMFKMGIIAITISFILIYLGFVEICPYYIVEHPGVLLAVFTLLCWYFSHKHFKTKLVPQGWRK
ncbi:MAG: hypothetical protein Q6367_001210 [Candidatus Freyarchaeota archaeon]